MPRDGSPVLAQVRQQIEVFSALARFEFDAPAAISFVQKDTVAQDAVNEIGRCPIKHDDIDGLTDGALDLAREIEAEPVQGSGRRLLEQYRDIDIAAGTSLPARSAAVQIGAYDRFRVPREESAQRINERLASHARKYITARCDASFCAPELNAMASHESPRFTERPLRAKRTERVHR